MRSAAPTDQIITTEERGEKSTTGEQHNCTPFFSKTSTDKEEEVAMTTEKPFLPHSCGSSFVWASLHNSEWRKIKKKKVELMIRSSFRHKWNQNLTSSRLFVVSQTLIVFVSSHQFCPHNFRYQLLRKRLICWRGPICIHTSERLNPVWQFVDQNTKSFQIY